MRKITLIAFLLFAVVPAAALAAKPSHPATPANSNANSNANGTSTTGTSSKGKGSSAMVVFVVRGTITGYTAGTSVSIKVSGANHESSALKTAGTLNFPVNSKTKITGTVTLNDTGIVKVKAPKNATASALEALAASQVVDQHANA
jgi:hypothetical protein